MHRTRVFVTLASLAFVFALGVQTPFAQDNGPAAQKPSQPPAPSAPSPSSPSAPAPSSPALGSAQATATATGELTEVDAKTKTITVKSLTGTEMKIKYDDATKFSGAQKTAAGLATATGQQVTVTYKKDGQSNIATMVDVTASTSPSPSAPRSPSPGSPDPTAPRNPGSPDPTAPQPRP